MRLSTHRRTNVARSVVMATAIGALVPAGAQAAAWGTPVALSNVRSLSGGPVAAELAGDGELHASWVVANTLAARNVAPDGTRGPTATFGPMSSAPTLAVLGGGRTVVAAGGSVAKLVVLRANGAVQGTTTISSADGLPVTVTQLAAGRALAVWTTQGHGPQRVMEAVLSPTGRLGRAARLTAPSESIQAQALPGEGPLVAAGRGGAAVVMWQQTSGKLVVRRVASNGTPGQRRAVTSAREAAWQGTTPAAISMNPAGDVAVAWERPAQPGALEGGQPSMRWLQHGGTLGPVVRLGPPGSGDACGVWIEALDSGGAMTVFDGGSTITTVPVSSSGTLGAAHQLWTGREAEVAVVSNGVTTLAAWQSIAEDDGSSFTASIYGATIAPDGSATAGLVAGGSPGDQHYFETPAATINAAGQAAVAYTALGPGDIGDTVPVVGERVVRSVDP